MTALARLAVLMAAVALAVTPGARGEVSFPAPPFPTQVSRTLPLQEAARRGMVDIAAKGRQFGDSMSVTLRHKPIRGPVTVKLRIEVYFFAGDATPSAAAAEGIEKVIEKRLNRPGQRTSAGDPVTFDADVQVRARAAAPRPGYHQVTLLDPLVDLRPPDPDFRDVAYGTPPNRPQEAGTKDSTWSLRTGTQWGHEALHLAGLPDRYDDYYRVDGRTYPIPKTVDSSDAADVTRWARRHQPPLPPPPAGRVGAQNKPGTAPCDIMGVAAEAKCGRIARRDLDWLARQAGVQVAAEPGDLLVSKDPGQQNMGVGFRTIVFAPLGRSTTAEGISAYCIDYTLAVPGFGRGYDVLGPARGRTEPGMAELARVLELNAQRQAAVDGDVPGVQRAIWAVTDALSPDESFDPPAIREVLAAAGVPAGVTRTLPVITSPNAASPATGAVTTTGVLPGIPTPAGPSVVPEGGLLAGLAVYPTRVAPGRRGRLEASVGVAGVTPVAVRLTLQRRRGGRWVAVGRPVTRIVLTREAVVGIPLPPLARGPHRVRVTSPYGTLSAPLTVAAGRRR